MTVEEEFLDRVRSMEKKEKEIEQRKYFEEKICNKPSPQKRTMDNRIVKDIDPKKNDFFP